MRELFVPQRCGLDQWTWNKLDELLDSQPSLEVFVDRIDKIAAVIAQRNFDGPVTLVFGSLWQSFDRLEPQGTNRNTVKKKSLRKCAIKEFLTYVFEQQQEETAVGEATKEAAEEAFALARAFGTPQRAGLSRPKTPRTTGLSTIHSVRSEPRRSVFNRALSSSKLRKDRKDALVACTSKTTENILRLGGVLSESLGGVLANQLVEAENREAQTIMDYFQDEDDALNDDEEEDDNGALLEPPLNIRITNRVSEPDFDIPAVVSKSSSMEDVESVGAVIQDLSKAQAVIREVQATIPAVVSKSSSMEGVETLEAVVQDAKVQAVVVQNAKVQAVIQDAKVAQALDAKVAQAVDEKVAQAVDEKVAQAMVHNTKAQAGKAHAMVHNAKEQSVVQDLNVQAMEDENEVIPLDHYKLANGSYDIPKLLGDIMNAYQGMNKDGWIKTLLSVPAYQVNELLFRHLSHRFPTTVKLSMFGLKPLRHCSKEHLLELSQKLGLPERYNHMEMDELVYELDTILKPSWFEKTPALRLCITLDDCMTAIVGDGPEKTELKTKLLFNYNGKELELFQWLTDTGLVTEADFGLELESGPRQSFWKHVPFLQDFYSISEFIDACYLEFCAGEDRVLEKKELLAHYNAHGIHSLIVKMANKLPSFYWPHPPLPASETGILYYTKHWPWVQVEHIQTISESGEPPYFTIAMVNDKGDGVNERQTISKYLANDDFGSIVHKQIMTAMDLAKAEEEENL